MSHWQAFPMIGLGSDKNTHQIMITSHCFELFLTHILHQGHIYPLYKWTKRPTVHWSDFQRTHDLIILHRSQATWPKWPVHTWIYACNHVKVPISTSYFSSGRYHCPSKKYAWLLQSLTTQSSSSGRLSQGSGPTRRTTLQFHSAVSDSDQETIN